MELRHVRVFLRLAEELHFGRAAARLRLAQSAVSQTLQALESEIGAQLFTRTRRSVTLSAAGASFLLHARQALVELERAETEARRAARGETGRIVLGMAMTTALTGVPRVIAQLHRERPGVDIQIVPAGTAAQLPALRQGTIDLGFMPLKEAPGLSSTPVAKTKLVAVLPRDHMLGRKRRIGLRQLASERFVFLRRSEDPQVLRWFSEHCRAAGFEPHVSLEVDHLEMLLACVASGLGVTCIPEHAAALGLRDVVYVPISPAIVTGIAAFWNPQRLQPATQRLLELLAEST